MPKPVGDVKVEGPLLYVSGIRPGDALQVPYPNGRPSVLLSTEGVLSQPEPSPAGREAVLVSATGAQTMLLVADAVQRTARPMSAEARVQRSPAWSPDGAWIAYAGREAGQWDIFKVQPAGGAPTNLTQTPDVDEGAPGWSPDGSSLTFVGNGAGNFDVEIMAGDGTGRRRLTQSQVDEDAPRWSPSGGLIAFEANRSAGPGMDIWVVAAAGGGEVNVTRSAADDRAASWAPDGQRLAFQSDRTGNSDIFVVGADGTALQQLTDDGGADTLPSWAPGGSVIAFLSNRRDADTSDIWVMSPDGGHQRLFAASARPGSFLSWATWRR